MKHSPLCQKALRQGSNWNLVWDMVDADMSSHDGLYDSWRDMQVRGYGLSGDAYHITQPAPDGRGAILAMQRALSGGERLLFPYSIPIASCTILITSNSHWYILGTYVCMPWCLSVFKSLFCRAKSLPRIALS